MPEDTVPFGSHDYMLHEDFGDTNDYPQTPERFTRVAVMDLEIAEIDRLRTQLENARAAWVETWKAYRAGNLDGFKLRIALAKIGALLGASLE